jgi:hypothetical protein
MRSVNATTCCPIGRRLRSYVSGQLSGACPEAPLQHIAEHDRILDTRIHALPAGRAVHMSRISANSTRPLR